MQKDTVIGAIVILIIVAGVVAYAAIKPISPQSPTSSEGIGTGGAVLPDGSYTEHAQYYDITTYYAMSTPLLAGVSVATDAAAIARMKNFIADAITQFKNDGNFASLTPAEIRTMGLDKGQKETLNIVYLVASSARTVSYIYTTYVDTGGAHGNVFFRTFTFDTKTGALLTLADLFKPGTDYLGTLSSVARAKLPAIIGQGADSKFINEGTTPEEKNFQSFFFDNQDFVILFDPYAVAPYAAGPQTLRISVSDLANILKPEYR